MVAQQMAITYLVRDRGRAGGRGRVRARVRVRADGHHVPGSG